MKNNQNALLNSDVSTALPTVSIVIPVYNAQDWIEQTLRSVFNQTYSNELLEIIIVDDGSTDHSVSIAESLLKQAPIKYSIIKINNSGPSKARNIGWQHAGGEWIQFLDADDLLHPQKIAIQANAAQTLSEEIAVIYSNWQRLALVNQEWRPVGEVVSPVIGDDPVTDLLKTENILHLSCQLIRRDWLEKVSGFDERYWMIEDIDLALRIAMAEGKFQYGSTGFPASFYRQRSNSLSKRNSNEFIEGCLRNARLVESYLRSKGELTTKQAYTLASVYFQGTRYFASIDRRKFESLAKKIESLVHNFLPPGPRALRWLSRLTGYQRAERIAGLYHHIKTIFKY